MRLMAVILCAFVIVGCAARPRPGGLIAQAPEYGLDDTPARTAAALVFDPPVTAGYPPLALARAERQPAAFVSYDQVFTTYFYLRVDDRQKLSRDGLSQRRVISETFGISRR